MLRAQVEDFATDMMQRLADEVGPQRFKIWFKGATSFALTGGFVTVGVPNQFVGGWIERHFAETIRRTAAELVGGPVDVNFSIDPALARHLRKKQPDSQMEFASNNPERLAREMKRCGAQPAQTLPKYSFDEFVVGASNRLAYSTALSVAERPATQFSPLFVHGGCGLGKTHLVQAICHKIQTDHPHLTSRYLSGEDFTNHYVFATRSGEVDKFRNHYRSVDVLVIDDVHFFSNKRGTQQEFLHTFNAIDAAGRQVVMASDAHPKMISHLSENLVSRFVSGMVVKIDPPDYQTRVEVLRRRAARMGREDIPDAALEYIAEVCDANIRELEGALLKLLMFAQVNQKPITRSLAVQGLRDLIQRTARVVRLSDIETVVAIYFGLGQADLHTSRKSRTIALARSVAMHLARTHTDMSFPEIGRFMGNKNHSTVLLACRRIGRQIEQDSRVRWLTGRGEQERRVREVLSELEEQLGRPTAAA